MEKTDEIMFEDLIKKDPSPGTKNRIIIASMKIQVPGWVINDDESDFIEIDLANLLKILKCSEQILFDVLSLGLIDIKNRPKCWVCGKDCRFLSIKDGYSKACCKEHAQIVKNKDLDKEIEDYIKNYPNKTLYSLFIQREIDNKFGKGKIELLENPLKGAYQGNNKLSLYCHVKDPISGKDHGHFEKTLHNLLADTSHGCNKCSDLASRNSWKNTLFEDIKHLYPGQEFTFLGVENNIDNPSHKDKLIFRCGKCGELFSISQNQIIYQKFRKDRPRETTLMCNNCSRNQQYENRVIWTEDACLELAKTCKTRTEFARKNSAAYSNASANGWLDEYTWLKTPEVIYKDPILLGRVFCVYKYDFRKIGIDGIYIGLTCNIEIRKKQHRSPQRRDDGKVIKSSVLKFCESNNLNLLDVEDIVLDIIESNLTAVEAQEKEDFWKNYYKEKGINIINIAKTGVGIGSIGSTWKKYGSIDSCVKELINYKKDHTWREALSNRKEPIIFLKNNAPEILDEIWPERYIPSTNRVCIQFTKDHNHIVDVFCNLQEKAEELGYKNKSSIREVIYGQKALAKNYWFEKEDKWLDRYNNQRHLDIIKYDALYEEYKELKNKLIDKIYEEKLLS